MPAAAQQQVTDDFLALLRKATAQQHIQLESATLSKKLLSDSVTIKDYTDYLLLMKSVIQFCEEEVFPVIAEVVPDINNRRKLQWIEQDLVFLNAPGTNNKTFVHPNINASDVSYALGFMYVVEGSTLGGRFILKHIRNTLLITENNGGTFFAGYTSATGSLWKIFLSVITKHAEVNNNRDKIIKGAQDAFDSIYNHFSSISNEN